MRRVGIATLLAAVLGLWAAAPAFAQTCYPSECPPPVIDVGDTDVSPGGTTGITGDNWCPGSTVDIYFDGEFVGTAQVGSDGTFDTSILIPDDAGPGDHVITVVGLDLSCTEVVSVPQNVTIAGGGAGASTLPFTGSNISVGVLLVLALLIVGATSIIAGRRRKIAEEK